MKSKLPPCTCTGVPKEGWVCGYCHAGMDIPKDALPELAKAFDGKEFNGSVQSKMFNLPDLAHKRFGGKK